MKLKVFLFIGVISTAGLKDAASFEGPLQVWLKGKEVILKGAEGLASCTWQGGESHVCDFAQPSLCVFTVPSEMAHLNCLVSTAEGSKSIPVDLMRDVRASVSLGEGEILDSVQVNSNSDFSLIGAFIEARESGAIEYKSADLEGLRGQRLKPEKQLRLEVRRGCAVRNVPVQVRNFKEPSLMPLAFASNPYQGLEHLRPLDLQGWGSDDPNFKRVLEQTRPELIIEVGTWKGGSALHMLEEAAKMGFSPEIICVDTWLGALEFWMDKNDPDRYRSLDLLAGFPSIYYQFLSNVVHLGRTSQVMPLPMTSLIAARWLSLHGVKSRLIYVDASHDEVDVMADLEAFWPLVEQNGILFGDDYGIWPGVTAAVQKFASKQGLSIIERDRQWMFEKP
jgi:hypothetical protein